MSGLKKKEMRLASLLLRVVLVVLLPAVSSGYANCAGNGSGVRDNVASLSGCNPGHRRNNSEEDSVGALPDFVEDDEMLAEITFQFPESCSAVILLAYVLQALKDMENEMLTRTTGQIHNVNKDCACLHENSTEVTKDDINDYYQNLADVMQWMKDMQNEMLTNCTSQINALKTNNGWQDENLMEAKEDDNKVSYQSYSFCLAFGLIATISCLLPTISYLIYDLQQDIETRLRNFDNTRYIYFSCGCQLTLAFFFAFALMYSL